MKKIIPLAIGLVALGGLAFFFMSSSSGPGPGRQGVSTPGDDVDPAEAVGSKSPRRSLIPPPKAGQAAPVPDDHEDPSDQPPRAGAVNIFKAEESALVGLVYSTVDDATRERLKVPARLGHGVIVQSMHPDSPAAEAALQADDVILRAGKTDVDSADQLAEVVGAGKHTLLTVARDGQLFQVVIHRPRPSE